MTPQPLEGVQGPMAGYLPSGQEGGPRMNTISLGVLIDFIIQRTYHDLTVLAELLPRKTDMERKIEIYNFSARSRQLFIRLIALVKWANSVSKVDKSANIMSFLDKQNRLFVETADMLARMSRETLVRARLPNFHIPAAVEVLTTGTYNRLPTCIREKIVPPDAITTAEKQQTLLRLNQVIQHRLVSANLLPQMKDFKIKNGRVTFEVKHEFKISFTVMSDSPNIPWRLLDIDILVEDKESGDCKALVHPMQVNYLHQFIQKRLSNNSNTLSDVYNILHWFCQSLQLEVLYTQTLRLSFERLGENVTIEEYVAGSKLTVSYWRELSSKDNKGDLGYRLSVLSNPDEIGRPLAVVHIPSLTAKESAEVNDRALASDHLSMERLIVHTVYIRSVSRLTDLKVEFQEFLKEVDFNLQGTPAILTVPVLTPCLRAEQIHIAIDTLSGMIRCHVPKHLDCPVMADLQACLNGDRSKLQLVLSELRYWITHRRCEKTLQHLPATVVERLPFLNPPDDPLMEPGREKIFVKLHRHPTVIVVVHLQEKKTVPNEMEYRFYMGSVDFHAVEMDVPVEDQPADPTQTGTQGPPAPPLPPVPIPEAPRVFIKLTHLVEFDTFATTHGPHTDVDELSPHKRKLSGEGVGPPAKQQKTIFPAYFIPELAHVVALCDETIPFLNLSNELRRNKIPISGLKVEANASSLVLMILVMPQPDLKPSLSLPTVENAAWSDLTKRLLSTCIRSQMNKNNQVRIWVVEFVFYGSPIQSTNPKEQTNRRTVHLSYEQTSHDFSKIVEDFLKDWSKIVNLYYLVYNFVETFKRTTRLTLPDLIDVKSFNYLSLLFGYGPKKETLCSIQWNTSPPGFRLVFMGGINAINAHSSMQYLLAHALNLRRDLMKLVYILIDTYSPLSSIARLPLVPHVGMPRPPATGLSFCIIAQSPVLVRLVYAGIYCLEIRFRKGRLVAIRDGAYSRFDRNFIDDATPIQGLKGFLTKYVDENAVYRGRPQSEDDNPPSPIGVEENFSGPGSVSGTSAGGSSPFLSAGMRGPQSPRDSGLRFPAPHTPPSSSNPHTPASPHPAAGGGVNTGQTHPNFNLTSPPAPHMPHPSPGGLMPSSPLNPQPSPHMVHSPGPNALYMQSHQDSPFTAMSPANTNWPGSPSMPRPSPRPGQSPDHKSSQPGGGVSGGPTGMSRVPLKHNWAGSMPTTLTHDAFDTLCRPSPHPNKDVNMSDGCSPIERFLGCVQMRRQLQRNVQSDDTLTPLNPPEAGVVAFKVDGLQCHVVMNQIHMQSLHLKVTQLPPPPTPDGKQMFQLTSDELMVIEQFFDTRVAVYPYRPNALNGFCRALSCAPQVLKDFVQIMRLEMKPELGGDQLKWTVQLCMRVPPTAAPIVPMGSPGVLICRLKILFFLQVQRIPYNGKDWKDGPSLVLPMVYDLSSNITQLAERREQAQSQGANAASTLLRRFAEFGIQHGQCSLFPAVRDLLTNLQLPNDIPPPNQSLGPVGPVGGVGLGVGVGVGGVGVGVGPVGPVGGVGGMVNVGGPGPMGQVGPNSNPMMHSPMQQMGQGAMGQGSMGPGQVNTVYSPMMQNQGPQ